MVKRFNGLTEVEKQKLYTFITSFGGKLFFSDYEGFVEDYSGPVFLGGQTQFSAWDGGEVRASLAMITRSVKERGEVILTSLYCRPGNEPFMEKILQEAMEDSLQLNPRAIRLGIRSYGEHLKSVVEKMGFQQGYQALVMRYQDHQPGVTLKSSELRLESLHETNASVFQDVHNRAFITSPNGGIMNDQEMANFLRQNVDNPLVCVCYLDDAPIGILEMEIASKEGIGWINSLAVNPDFQGRGLGSVVLKAAVDRLKARSDVEKIQLVVISTNHRAYGLYQKYGFEIEEVMSDWYEIVYRP